MKKVFLFLCFIICLISCSQHDVSLNAADKTQETSNQSNLSQTDINPIPIIKPTPIAQPSKIKILVPKVSDFSIQTFFRHSDKKDLRMDRLPPFVYGEINFFVNSTKVKIGDSITAVWLDSGDEENLTLKVKAIKRSPFLDCDTEKIGSEVEFGKITEQRLLEMKASANRTDDQPFDYLLIYPAVKNAKRLDKSVLTKEMLPESVAVEQVFAAIDLNDDGKPDLLISNYCCYDSSQCDCTNNYQKIDSKWKYLGGSEPC